MHDTQEGALILFRSHNPYSSYGQHLKNYPMKMQNTILKMLLSVLKKKGYHLMIEVFMVSPTSNFDRSALDYYRNKTFGSVVVTPI